MCGMAIPATVVGSGPTRVLALHGWFGSARGWGWLPELIDQDSYSYAFVDYRGYGARRDEPGEYTMAEISADARELADELGWDTYALLGHSMGGKAMLQVYADAPERVTAMVGVSPVPASALPFDDQSWALFDGAAERDENRYAIIDLTTGGRHSKTWLDSMVRHSVDNSTRTAFGAYLRPWAKGDFAADVPAPTVPVTVIAGEHDAALGPDAMRGTWLAQFPSCTLETFPNAGHYAMYETPVALATSLEKALR
ncbi:esterase [Actinocatenispora comari]|uniref:Esterase n=2 Tax=Actinocatenispora comari TaxID=2807577 RepID=A0A8J4A5I4_9ACTN|nr:esterase [Actinocatenispora comari]